LPFHNSFERILLDAPCSSLGTLARNPDIKWRLQEKDLGSHAATQGQLLASCAAQLAPGGRLVYATCSTEPEENEEVIEKFLSGHTGFSAANPPQTFPTGARHLIGPDQALRTEPGRDDVDGYYAIALTRTEY
jgi:16S rRNA (cytosine967-C5)-methyltransferase